MVLARTAITIGLVWGTLAVGQTSPTGSSGGPGPASESPSTSNGVEPGKAPANEEDDNVIKAPPRVAAKKRVFSEAERKKICARFEGQMISYYGDIYKVEHCKRRPVHSNDYVFSLMRSGAKIVEVEATPIAALAEGKPLDPGSEGSTTRSCDRFNGRYITFSYGDIYFVQKCTRQMIPDWETYVLHRRERGIVKSDDAILGVSNAEFEALKPGRDIPSVVDKEFAKMAAEWAPVDVIPIDEACHGVEGKVVSFHSRMYRVEKCRKREIDPEDFLWRERAGRAIVELRAEQWLSLPNGQPISNKKAEAKPEPYDPGAPR